MRRLVVEGTIWLVSSALFIGGGVLGIFAVSGLAAWIWGPEILQTALGDSPDRSHPAFWLLLVLSVPAMFISFAGTFFVAILPLFYWFGAPFWLSAADKDLLRMFARWLGRLAGEKSS